MQTAPPPPRPLLPAFLSWAVEASLETWLLGPDPSVELAIKLEGSWHLPVLHDVSERV